MVDVVDAREVWRKALGVSVVAFGGKQPLFSPRPSYSINADDRLTSSAHTGWSGCGLFLLRLEKKALSASRQYYRSSLSLDRPAEIPIRAFDLEARNPKTLLLLRVAKFLGNRDGARTLKCPDASCAKLLIKRKRGNFANSSGGVKNAPAEAAPHSGECFLFGKVVNGNPNAEPSHLAIAVWF